MQNRLENPELERLILAAPDDAQAYLVYGAWLRSQGDARGDLCAMQAELRELERDNDDQLVRGPERSWAVEIADSVGVPLPTVLRAAGIEAQAPGYNSSFRYGDEVFGRAKLREAEALFNAQRANWLRGLETEIEAQQVWQHFRQWELGFLREATVQERDCEVAAQVLEKLVHHPEARFLRRLHFNAPVDQRVIASLVRHAPQTLRALGFRTASDSPAPCTLVPLYSLSQLEELWVACERGQLTLGQIDLPALRNLEFRSSMTRAHARSLCTANLPKLKQLSLTFETSHGAANLPSLLLSLSVMKTMAFFSQDRVSLRAALPTFWAVLRQHWLRMSSRYRGLGQREEQAPCTIADFSPLLDARAAPALAWLSFRRAPFADQLPEALAHSQLLKQLAVLEIEGGPMTDAGARALLEHAGAFAHLGALNLSFNRISPDLVEELGRAFPRARLRYQEFPSPTFSPTQDS